MTNLNKVAVQKILFTCFLLSLAGMGWAQELSLGFKAGLNFSRFLGPTEMEEDYTTVTGFHIGATFAYQITDIYGVEGELLFNQKGTEQFFEGESYAVFWRRDQSASITQPAQRRMTLNIINSYVEMPVMVFAKFGRLKVSAGPSIAFLVGSSGSGEVIFSDYPLGNEPMAAVELDYNYLRDKAGEGNYDNILVTASFQNTDYVLPQQIGAFYEYTEDEENYFNLVDVGLNLGLSYFFNDALYLGYRFNFGLIDVTNNKIDRVIGAFPQDDFLLQDDRNTNFSMQASIGFSF